MAIKTEQELIERVYNLIPQEQETDDSRWVDDVVDRILALVKEAGYVKLADDQSLPRNPYPVDDNSFDGRIGYGEGQQDMLKVVDGKAWRKVIMEVKDGS